MLLIGLWHSITWASAVFGLYHAAFLVGHRMVERRRPASTDQVWRFAKPVFVFVWFGLSLPLLQLDIAEAVDFYGAMVGVSPCTVSSPYSPSAWGCCAHGEASPVLRSGPSPGVSWSVWRSRHGPTSDDRDHVQDVPPSDVSYLGPTSRQDFGGFLAPPHRTDEPFTVAWIGGSEVKLQGVSLAGEVSNGSRRSVIGP